MTNQFVIQSNNKQQEIMIKSVTVTVEEMNAILQDPKNYNGCSFVGLDTVTVPKLSGGKKNPMQGKVQKISTGQVAMLFSNKTRSAYGSMVNRRKEQSGQVADFQPSKLPWGERVKDTAAITNKGAGYLQLIFVQKAVNLLQLSEQMGVVLSDSDNQLMDLMKEKVVGYKSKNGEVSYTLEGSPIEKEDIEGLIVSSNGKQGGLSDAMKVIVRTPKTESFTRLTMGGTTYNIAN